MNVASVALAIVSVVAVRTPANETGKASGTTTRAKRCTGVMPIPVAASSAAGETPRIPRSTLMTIGGMARSASATTAGAAPTPSHGRSSIKTARLGSVRPMPARARTALRKAGDSAARTPTGNPTIDASASAEKARARCWATCAGSSAMRGKFLPPGWRNPAQHTKPRNLHDHPASSGDDARKTPVVSLDDPSLYISRELSWLEFNDRVLEEALDARNPLLERLKFVAIYGTNLDEFFMIRVAAIKQQIEAQVVRRSDDGRTPTEHLAAISQRLRTSLPRRCACSTTSCCRRSSVTASASSRLAISTTRRRSRSSAPSTRASFRCSRRWRSIAAIRSRTSRTSRSRSPSSSKRRRATASSCTSRASRFRRRCRASCRSRGGAGERCFVLLEDLIAHHLDGLFPGMHVRDAYLFRVTRDADLDLQEDEADDLLRAIESELRRRRFGEPVRLEIERGMPEYMRDLLCDALELDAVDCYEIDGMMALSDLWQIVNLPDYERCATRRSCRRFRSACSASPISSRRFAKATSCCTIRTNRSIRSCSSCASRRRPEGARDQSDALPHVGQELADRARAARRAPRTRNRSPSSSNSRRASTKRTTSSGRAAWSARARTSSTASPNQKVHAKTLLVVREDEDGTAPLHALRHRQLQREDGALYTDLSLFTCRPELGADVTQLFNALTGFSKVTDYEELWVAPVTLAPRADRA